MCERKKSKTQRKREKAKERRKRKEKKKEEERKRERNQKNEESQCVHEHGREEKRDSKLGCSLDHTTILFL